MSIPIYTIAICPENIPWLWSRVRNLRVFDPDSEEWLLRVDMLIAFKRYGRDYVRIAEYLEPGREEWDILA
jgi:hypothetical protein